VIHPGFVLLPAPSLDGERFASAEEIQSAHGERINKEEVITVHEMITKTTSPVRVAANTAMGWNYGVDLIIRNYSDHGFR
jgi:hypothetical protein